MMNRYFIRDDYQINPTPITSEHFSDGLYWNQSRIKASRVYQYYVYRDAAKIAQEHDIKTLCDVGCGTGEKLRNIHESNPNLNIVGIDQKHAIEYCLNTHGFGEWLVDDFAEPKLKICGDMTICSDVIEHLVDPDVLISYLKRVTTPGGLILISTPDRDRLRGEACTYSPNRHHIREWNFDEFSRYLHSHHLIPQRHYHSPAVRYSVNRFFFSEARRQIIRGKTLTYNQVALVRNPI